MSEQSLSALDIVRRARTPAVAVDRDDAILGSTSALEELLGRAPRQGASLVAELDLRDAVGNALASGHYRIWEMIARGEPVQGFRVQMRGTGDDPVRADVSIVVVADGRTGDHELVYFFQPIRPPPAG